MRRLFFFVGGVFLALVAAADQVELSDGSLIKGKILSIEAGKLKIETSFVGTVNLALADVKSFATDEPVNVGVAGGPIVLSRVVPSASGVRIAGDGLAISTESAQVTTLWRHGAESPTERHAREIAEKAKRKWAYEASGTITGRTGASEKFNAAAGLKATLSSSRDRLVFSLSAERAEDKGVETANHQFGGVDYSSFYLPDRGWYVRSSLETDQIKALDVRSNSAFGMTRKLMRRSSLDVEFRSGASYVYEDYTNGKKFNSPGLDFTLLSTRSVAAAKISSTLGYTPAFRDFGNYRLRHESALEVPVSVSLWKLKLGLMNEYQSIPPAGVDRFDTTYFTSLLLNWK